MYNTLSCLGWGYILLMTYVHLAGITLPGIFNSSSEPSTALSFQALITFIRELFEELATEAKGLLSPSNHMLITVIIPPQLLGIYTRMTTTYDVVGSAVAIVQTVAVLEIVHAFSGLVKSPLPTAVIQVYSRLFLVWGVAQKHEQVCWDLPHTHSHSLTHSRTLVTVSVQPSLCYHDSRMVHNGSDSLFLLRSFAGSRHSSRYFSLPAVHYLLCPLSDWCLQRSIVNPQLSSGCKPTSGTQRWILERLGLLQRGYVCYLVARCVSLRGPSSHEH